MVSSSNKRSTGRDRARLRCYLFDNAERNVHRDLGLMTAPATRDAATWALLRKRCLRERERQSSCGHGCCWIFAGFMRHEGVMQARSAQRQISISSAKRRATTNPVWQLLPDVMYRLPGLLVLAETKRLVGGAGITCESPVPFGLVGRRGTVAPMRANARARRRKTARDAIRLW